MNSKIIPFCRSLFPSAVIFLVPEGITLIFCAVQVFILPLNPVRQDQGRIWRTANFTLQSEAKISEYSLLDTL